MTATVDLAPAVCTKQALAAVFVEATEYMTDDTAKAEDVKAFVAQHFDAFQELVEEFVAERV